MNARVPYVYAGLSVLEASFAQYRAARRGLGPDLFRVLPPYDVSGDWKLDPLAAFKPSSPLHGKIGTILAFDVLEHVPHFERTVAAMVAALRPGGLLVEQSPFEEGDEAGVHEHNGTDTRLHTSRHGVTMAQAMGPTMKHVGGSVGTSGTHLWRKRGVDGEWKDTCCISGFWPDNCRGWQKRCNLK